MTAPVSRPTSNIQHPSVQPKPLSDQQRRWVERAWAELDAERLAQLDLDLTRIPSPTGEERAAAEFLTAHMTAHGLEARYQPIDDQQGNAIGQLGTPGDGPDLLLYAPIDTAFTGRADEDLPWIGPTVQPHFSTDAFIEEGFVIGQGAENPKGYVASIVAAAEAVAQAGVPLRGRLLVGLGAGGMPTNRRLPTQRFNVGHGSGCSFMLDQGLRPDFAIIAKPGYAVAWEEVGLCWFKVTVRGSLNYTGIRHLSPARNSIVDAMHVIAGLEAWFPEYTARNTSGLVAPQGSIGAIEAGWPHKPAFVPAACDIYVDLRVSPRTSLMDVRRQFGQAIDGIRQARPEITVDWDSVVSIAGTHTDPSSWIVQSLIRAWEFREGQPHQPLQNTSGATDAAILRSHGIPTARLGMPRPKVPDKYAGLSLGVCSIEGMTRLTECLAYAIVDTCTRTLDEIQ